jgi:hypothetical protein
MILCTFSLLTPPVARAVAAQIEFQSNIGSSYRTFKSIVPGAFNSAFVITTRTALPRFLGVAPQVEFEWKR